MAATLLGKYLLYEVIGEGGFGEVRRAQHIETGQDIAIKFAHFVPNSLSLFTESEILSQLQGYEGIPKVFAYGKLKDCEYMVTELLGKSLMERFRQCGKRFSAVTVGRIAVQVLDRLEFTHGRGYLHRDIKPQNLLTGLLSPRTIYLTDFGLAKKYINEFHIHIPYKIDTNIAGTLYFASNNTLRGIQSSRRDDMESLLHVLVYFLKGTLPWAKKEGVRGSAEAAKLAITPQKLCAGLPLCVLQAVTYVKSLQFEEKPNYAYLKRLFEQLWKPSEKEYCFDWEAAGFVRGRRRSQSLTAALFPINKAGLLGANRANRKLNSTFIRQSSQAIIIGNAIRKQVVGQALAQPAFSPSDADSNSQEDTIKDHKLPTMSRKLGIGL